MYISPNVKMLRGEVDIAELKNACINLTEANWAAYDFRQKNYPSLQNTTTFAFLWKYNEQSEVECFNLDHNLWALVNPHVTYLEKLYDGIAVKVALTRLHPNKSITPHIDYGFLQKVHRCHIPIVTNERVIFFIDCQPYTLSEGCTYEINNALIHHVENNSEHHRIHLAIDILPNNEPKPVS